MDISKNNGTPKSSSLIGFSIINHQFLGTPILGNTHVTFPNLNLILGKQKIEFFLMWYPDARDPENSIKLDQTAGLSSQFIQLHDFDSIRISMGTSSLHCHDCLKVLSVLDLSSHAPALHFLGWSPHHVAECAPSTSEPVRNLSHLAQ